MRTFYVDQIEDTGKRLEYERRYAFELEGVTVHKPKSEHIPHGNGWQQLTLWDISTVTKCSDCRYTPCNEAQGCECCKECPTKCGSPCERSNDK